MLKLTRNKLPLLKLAMGRDQNLREFVVNMISLFTIWVKREIDEWQFSPIFRDFDLSEKLVYVISRKNTEMTWIGRKLEFKS